MKRVIFDTFHDAQFVQPGVRGKLTCDLAEVQNLETLRPVTLKKGQRVIIQPVSTSVSPDYLLTCYSDDKDRERDDMPESSGDIVRGNSFLVHHINPKKAFQFDEFFRRSREPLFPNARSPNITEINQFQIPDCALLATLQAILNHPNGAAYIRNMMRDNGDGTTTVRFFDPKTQRPTYYTVTNSIAYKGTAQLSSHPVLWVHVLEKAFAARGLRGEAELVDASIPSVYSGGLTIEFCMQSMVATSGHLIEFNSDAKKFFPENLIQDWKVSEYLNNLLNTISQSEIVEETIKQLLKDFLKGYLNNSEDTGPLLEVFSEKNSDIAKERYVQMLAQLYIFPNILPLNEEKIVTALKKTPHYETYLELKKCGSNGSNYANRAYSKAELDVYSAVQTSIAQGALIAASCNISDIGLVDGHAYSVTNVVKKKHEYLDKVTGEKISKERLYIQVRNPWGYFGREYDEKQSDLKAKESAHPEFLVELKDFYRCFGHIYSSDSVNHLFEEAYKKERLEKDIQHVLNATMSFEEYSLANLISEDFLVEKITNDLIALELLSLSQLTEEENEKITACLKSNDKEARKKLIFSTFSNKTLDYFGGNREEIKTRLYHLIMIRENYSASKEHIEALQNNSPYRVYWDAIQTRKNIINLFVSYETNIFLEAVDALNNDVISFLNKLNTEVNAVDFIANKQVAIESYFAELNEHLIFIKKFSNYLPNHYHEALHAVEKQLKVVEGLVADTKEKSTYIIASLGDDIESIFNKMRAETIDIEHAAFRWNKARKLPDAAKQAIDSAIAACDIALARKPILQCFVSDQDCSKEVTARITELAVLQRKFKQLCKGFSLSSGDQYERGSETLKEKSTAIAEILNPLVDAKNRLRILSEKLDNKTIRNLVKELTNIETMLVENIQSSVSQGKSYYEIAEGEAGRIVSNIAQCFDKETCESVAVDLKDAARKEATMKRIENLESGLKKQSSLIRKEMACCSFSVDYELSRKAPDTAAHFRKTYSNLTKLKSSEDEFPLKSEAYLLMRDCTRTDSEENKNRFVAFTQRPEVKKSSIGKTIAISMLGFLGLVGIAGLVVLSHGLALPLVPILIAKGLAIGAVATSVAGLGGVAVETKIESTKKAKLKNTIFSFFKPALKSEEQSKKMESEAGPKKTR